MPVAARHSRRTAPPRWLLWAVAGLVVLGGVLYGAAYLLAGGGVLPNTTAAGVSIGGLSPSKAEAKLQARLAAKATAPIRVLVGDKQADVDPVAAGLTFDPKATVAAAGKRTANPFTLVAALLGHREVEPAVAIDTTKMTDQLDKLDAELGGGHDGGIEFDGITPVAVEPVKGQGIVKEKAIPALRAAFLTSSEPVRLATTAVEPVISADVVRRAIETVAKPAVAAPISLRVGATDVELSPAVIAKNLTFKAAGGELAPVIDGEGVATALGDKLKPLHTPGKDASFDLSSGVPVIVPSAPGTTADVEKLGAAIAAVLPNPAPRSVTVPTTSVQPSFTTEAAQALGIKEKVSTFTTHHPCCAPRVTNIHKMADIVNGHVVMPGDTFSINGFVGERDRARGFVPAPMIFDGLYVDSVGGGVSQFATTLFNAVFFAGLEDVEHHPHSYYISRYPAGREATVSFPEPNMIFRNDTATGILIQTSYTGTSLTITFWGTKYYDIESSSSPRYAFTTAGTRYNTRPDCESASGNQGFQIDVTQTFKKDGEVVKTKKYHTRYDAEPVIVCGPAPSPTPAATPTASGTPGSSPPPADGRRPAAAPTP
ncbi:MAG TPA: VanW family protein [Acidothermaceae bacterium]